MKRYIVNLVLYSIVSLWIFSSCEDYDFKDIPDPVIPEGCFFVFSDAG